MDFSETEKTEEERKYPRYYIKRLEELVKTRQQKINQLETLCRKLIGEINQALLFVNGDEQERIIAEEILESVLEAAKKVLGE